MDCINYKLLCYSLFQVICKTGEESQGLVGQLPGFYIVGRSKHLVLLETVGKRVQHWSECMVAFPSKPHKLTPA